MVWVLDSSDQMMQLRAALGGDQVPSEKFDRLYAMGVDVYNIALRLETLQQDSSARYFGVTSSIHLAERGRLLRTPLWAMFNDGIPEKKPALADSEQGEIANLIVEVLPISHVQKPE